MESNGKQNVQTIAFNGSRIHVNPGTRRCFLVVLAVLVLFPLISFVFNNLVFGVGYEGIKKLEDDWIQEWKADDLRLIHHIRKNYLIPPSPRSKPYNLLFPDKKDWSHKRQSMIVADILQNRPNGFFLEAGAYDGETYSNSLYFEKYLNWTGILVEPDFANIKRLRQKNRKAWTLNGCLDGTRYPTKMTLYGAMETGTLSQYMTPIRKLTTRFWRPTQATEVWCFPLQSVLLAVNQTKVDYMVLDIEGSEMPVLRGTPWDKIDVDVFQIEYMIFSGVYWDKDRSRVRRTEMRNFMAQYMPTYTEHSVVFLDLIYVKNELMKKKQKEKS